MSSADDLRTALEAANQASPFHQITRFLAKSERFRAVGRVTKAGKSQLIVHSELLASG